MLQEMFSEGMDEGNWAEGSFRTDLRLAVLGDPEGMHDLAMRYLTGFGVEENRSEGWKWMVKAAKLGYVDALRYLCNGYGDMPVPYCSQAEVVKWLTRAADKGNGAALHLLGQVYEKGELTAKDERRAFRLYQRAVKKGEEPARVSVACCYVYGRGVDQNVDKGMERLFDATIDELQDAYYALGRIFHEGGVVQRDDYEARRWLQRAASCGDGRADALLEDMGPETNAGDSPDELFERGHDWYLNSDDPEEEREGFQMIIRAADAGSGRAAFFLGGYYWASSGARGEDAKAEKYWLQVVDDPEFKGQVDGNLATLYWNRESTPENDEKLAHHARIAAEDGCIDSMYFLGCCAMQGRGMDRNLAEAAKWLALAAEAGKLEAAVPLFEIHLQTDESLPETGKALFWLRHAAEHGITTAQIALAMYLMFLPGTGNKSNALKWYKRAAAAGAPEAQFFLGAYHLGGGSGHQDLAAATKWLSAAAAQGHTGAADLLARHGLNSSTAQV